MSVIDDIKDRLRIEEVVGRTVPLTRSGKHLRGLCPFHSEKTPSFFVFQDTQRYKCFGCGAGGDLVDFVMQREGWDMQSTLRELAREAHIELRPLSPEEKRAIELTREKETILAVAAEWLHAQMGTWDGKAGRFTGEVGAGLAYARKRGFTDETIRAAALGWFGNDWDGLQEALGARKVVLDAPAAVALIGFRGDVAVWADTHGVTPASRWVELSKIPAMPPQMLIYPHVLGGRVTYLSGRRIAPEGDTPKSWNPPRELVGERQPFFNGLWGTAAGGAVVVEGQACAITLGQWGVAAVAKAGCA